MQLQILHMQSIGRHECDLTDDRVSSGSAAVAIVSAKGNFPASAPTYTSQPMCTGPGVKLPATDPGPGSAAAAAAWATPAVPLQGVRTPPRVVPYIWEERTSAKGACTPKLYA